MISKSYGMKRLYHTLKGVIHWNIYNNSIKYIIPPNNIGIIKNLPKFEEDYIVSHIEMCDNTSQNRFSKTLTRADGADATLFAKKQKSILQTKTNIGNIYIFYNDISQRWLTNKNFAPRARDFCYASTHA
jgi:hypothetical protein